MNYQTVSSSIRREEMPAAKQKDRVLGAGGDAARSVIAGGFTVLLNHVSLKNSGFLAEARKKFYDTDLQCALNRRDRRKSAMLQGYAFVTI
jgi:hypothetical protein